VQQQHVALGDVDRPDAEVLAEPVHREHRQPVAAHLPGEHLLADQRGPRGHDDLADARLAREQRLAGGLGERRRDDVEALLGHEAAHVRRAAGDDEHVAHEHPLAHRARLAVGVLHPDERDPLGHRQGVHRRADERRVVPHAHAREALVEPVVLEDRLEVVRQVRGDLVRLAVRQQAAPEQHRDGGGQHHERQADHAELEEAEPLARLAVQRVGDDDVDGAAGQHEQRAGARGERGRHQQARRLQARATRREHDDRHERRRSPVRRDDRGEQRRQRHDRDQQPPAVGARVLDQRPTRPRGDARTLQPRGDHEQARDEHHDRVAEPRHRRPRVDEARGVHRERGQDGHQADRQPVPHEQRDGPREHDQAEGRVAHGSSCSTGAGLRGPRRARTRPSVPVRALMVDLPRWSR
jgi:hypothetical protein